MWLFVVKMGRILQTLGLLDICFCGAPIRAWRPFFCRETSESSKCFTRRGNFIFFFPFPDVDTMTEMTVILHRKSTAEGRAQKRSTCYLPLSHMTPHQRRKCCGRFGVWLEEMAWQVQKNKIRALFKINSILKTLSQKIQIKPANWLVSEPVRNAFVSKKW